VIVRLGAGRDRDERGTSMKRNGLIILAVVAIVIIMIAGRLFGSYNNLVTANEGVKNGWAEVNNQLQARSSKLGNLAETVKGTALQEQQVFGDIAKARAALGGARTPQEGIAADQATTSALSRLLIVVENYPQLKSNEAFLTLMDEISGIENRLSVSRMRYNEVVRGFNVMVKRFPTNLYAGVLGFKEQPYYPVAEEAKATPKLDFGGIRQVPATPPAQP
jgi:LemA protein